MPMKDWIIQTKKTRSLNNEYGDYIKLKMDPCKNVHYFTIISLCALNNCILIYIFVLAVNANSYQQLPCGYGTNPDYVERELYVISKAFNEKKYKMTSTEWSMKMNIYLEWENKSLPVT